MASSPEYENVTEPANRRHFLAGQMQQNLGEKTGNAPGQSEKRSPDQKPKPMLRRSSSTPSFSIDLIETKLLSRSPLETNLQQSGRDRTAVYRMTSISMNGIPEKLTEFQKQREEALRNWGAIE